jgi:hypothetical protein
MKHRLITTPETSKKKFEAMLSIKMAMVAVFWNLKGVHLVGFLDCGDAPTAESYFSTHERIWQTIHCRVLGCEEVPPFCMIMSGLIRPLWLVTGYGTMAGRLWTTYLQSQYDAQRFPFIWTQKHLADKWFSTDADMKQSFAFWLQALVPHGDKC